MADCFANILSKPSGTIRDAAMPRRRYDIRYSTSAINDSNWASASQAAGEPLPQVAGTNQSFVVPGLSPSTTYYFALKTADDVLNWSGISNSPSGATSAPPPASETESFGYDFLDRLTSVSGAYSETYTYSQIGNMLTRNGVSYTYGDTNHKHAVTAVGATGYVYDNNGNMTTRGTQTLSWDIENRPLTVTGGASFIYDGDGNRVKKTEGGQTILYVNNYYEKNLTTSEVTTYYYLGDKLVAKRTGTTVEYIHEDHLTGTSVVSSSTGAFVGGILYTPYGATRSGDVPTDKKFTGQRLDGTGLYYYGARYYDPAVGRFVSPDTIVPNPANPQSLNRYSYTQNNPLKYTDPTGHVNVLDDGGGGAPSPLPPPVQPAPPGPGLPVPPGPLGPPQPVTPQPPAPSLPGASPATGAIPVAATLVRTAEGVTVSPIFGVIGWLAWIAANLQASTNPDAEAARWRAQNETPSQNPGRFRPWRQGAKINNDTGEVWVEDQSGHTGDHYEVYKNKKAFENGRRDRAVWPDGRVREVYR